MKRFTETTKWDDPWFIRLSAADKLLWIYICDKCDCSGVIDFCPEVASVVIGRELVDDRALGVFGRRVRKLESGKWQIVQFLPFQYKTVDAKCPAHKPVIECIQRNGIEYPIANLTDNLPDRVGYRLSNNLVDRAKEKEKDLTRARARERDDDDGSEDSCSTLLNAVKVLSGTTYAKFKEWQKVRRAMGRKPKDWNKMFAEQVKWLCKFPEAEQIEILSASIRNNWQGLFAPKNRNRNAAIKEEKFTDIT